IPEEVQARRTGPDRRGEFADGRLAAAARGELVQSRDDERLGPCETDAADERLEVRARDVAAEGDARDLTAELAGAALAGVPRRSTDPEDLGAPPGPVPPRPDDRPWSRRAVLERARFHQPLVGQAPGMGRVRAPEDRSEPVHL